MSDSWGILVPAVVVLVVSIVLVSRPLFKKATGAATKAIDTAQALEELLPGEYLRASVVDEWQKEAGDPKSLLLPPFDVSILTFTRLRRPYNHAAAILRDVEAWVKKRNQEFMTAELLRIEAWADNRFGQPITEAQRRALIVDEDCNLIVAGAGAGKTTTILAKVAYLVERRGIDPRELLVLAFNKKVAREIRERLTALGLPPIEVSTFHAKGYEILGRAEGGKPAISALAEDDEALLRFLDSIFEKTLETDAFYSRLSHWWVDRRVEPKDFEACETPDERIRREKMLGLRTLDGCLVKSQAEVKVGDWLTLHAVRWEYENVYPGPRRPDRRDYTPDFFLPDHEIWIEVWACSRSGRYPPEINTEKYAGEMEWKRDLHTRKETELLEIYQDEIWRGGLGDFLTQELSTRDVPINELGREERIQLLKSDNESISPFVTLVRSFLNLFRAGAWTREQITARANTQRDREFLELFWPFLEAYEAKLGEEGKIDFHEMLIAAAKSWDHETPSPYRYVLVDEFQDTSRARLELLKRLRGPHQAARLFLVGDDWQSIYRFTGADVGFFTGPEPHLGPTARTDLVESFRLNRDVAELSTRFVTRNPNQLKKKIRAGAGSDGEPGVSIRFVDRGEEVNALQAVLDEMARGGHNSTNTLVLGRYNFTVADVQEGGSHHERIGDLETMTVHRAKGLEADNVIVLGMDTGVFGFPCGIIDDRVLRLLMSEPDRYPDAEERRLFYVALTRTAGRVHLLANSQSPSGFVQELLDDEFAAWIETVGEESARYRCPRCQGRTIKRWTGKHGAFWACINYPACRGRLPICSECNIGILEPEFEQQRVRVYRCSECQAEVDVCPRCRAGALISKKGRHGPFLGCSGWRRDGSGCGYTKDDSSEADCSRPYR